MCAPANWPRGRVNKIYCMDKIKQIIRWKSNFLVRDNLRMSYDYNFVKKIYENQLLSFCLSQSSCCLCSDLFFFVYSLLWEVDTAFLSKRIFFVAKQIEECHLWQHCWVGQFAEAKAVSLVNTENNRNVITSSTNFLCYANSCFAPNGIIQSILYFGY